MSVYIWKSQNWKGRAIDACLLLCVLLLRNPREELASGRTSPWFIIWQMSVSEVILETLLFPKTACTSPSYTCTSNKTQDDNRSSVVRAKKQFPNFSKTLLKTTKAHWLCYQIILKLVGSEVKKKKKETLIFRLGKASLYWTPMRWKTQVKGDDMSHKICSQICRGELSFLQTTVLNLFLLKPWFPVLSKKTPSSS